MGDADHTVGILVSDIVLRPQKGLAASPPGIFRFGREHERMGPPPGLGALPNNLPNNLLDRGSVCDYICVFQKDIRKLLGRDF